MAENQLRVLLLFLLTLKTGFSDEIPVFVQTGASVQLDIQTQELPEFDDLSWRNEKSENIVKYFHKTKEVRLHSSYKDRVDFNDKTFSLTLKNMQKTDNGLYTARTSGQSDNNIVTYRVSVIDAVEAPVLTVNSNWFSGNFCTVNFTCRAHELMINSSYQNNRCSPEEVTSHEIHTLILNCSEESIICNHSNPVSWKEDKINITQLCVNKGNDQRHEPSHQIWPYVVAFCIAVIAIAIIATILYFKCKKGAQEAVIQDSTVYSQVETQEMENLKSDCHTYDIPDWIQAQTQVETADKRPNTTYCTVGQYQKLPETIYSVVCKQPNKEPPAISSNDA